MSKLGIRPAPSPNNTNREHLYLKTEIVRGSQLGMDSASPMRGSRLMRALKARYKHSRDVMAALGLDASLLARDSEPEETVILRREGMSAENIQKLIDGHTSRSDVRGGTGGEIVGAGGDDIGEQIVEKYGSFDDLPPKIETMPEERLSADDDDEDRDDVETSLRDYLRKSGLSEDQIQGAIDAGKHGRYRRRGNGHDRHARDVLPRTASGVAERGGSFPGAHISGGRTQPVHAMDAAQKARLTTMYPHLARIEREPEVRQPHQIRDRRSALDAAPRMQNEKQRERMHRMFPGMRDIGTA